MLSSEEIQKKIDKAIQAMKVGSYEAAKPLIQEVLSLFPDHEVALDLMGLLLQAQKKYQEASREFEKVLKKDPQNAVALYRIGTLFLELNRPEEAVIRYQKVNDRISSEDFFVRFAHALFLVGDYEASKKVSAKGLTLFPNSLLLKLQRGLELPAIYRDLHELESFRQNYEQTLDQLIKETKEGLLDKNTLLFILDHRANFYLAYQGQNDLELQKKYSNLYMLLQDKKTQKLSRKKREKYRIGYLSPNFTTHSISHTTIGFLEKRNSSRFEAYGYFVGSKKSDAMTDEVKKHCDQFRFLSGNIDEIQKIIFEDELDVLFFADIGMDAVTSALAMRRSAPIQVTTQGHPVTTGSPMIDCFFSSRLMEPENAQLHYSEKLLLLSGLGYSYRMPQLPGVMLRQEIGLPNDSFIYFSGQSLFKYLPQYDFIYPKILKEVPEAILVFIAHPMQSYEMIFRERLMKACQQVGVSFEKQIKILPRLDRQTYLKLLPLVDACLDSLPWSGNNTSLEYIALGKGPIVTKPGLMMRHRHTYAQLKILGFEEGIANSEEEYIQIAVRFAQDRHFYEKSVAMIKKNRDRLFNDEKPIREYEEFLIKVLEASD